MIYFNCRSNGKHFLLQTLLNKFNRFTHKPSGVFNCKPDIVDFGIPTTLYVFFQIGFIDIVCSALPASNKSIPNRQNAPLKANPDKLLRFSKLFRRLFNCDFPAHIQFPFLA